MTEITYYKGILPPTGRKGADRRDTRASRQTRSDDLILEALTPLRDELDAALARGDEESALRLAYGALSAIADLLAHARGDLLQAWQVRIHALLVELKALPLQTDTDGTVREQGTAVNVMYRNWAIERSQADNWAQSLPQRFQSLMPGSWRVMPATAASTGNLSRQNRAGINSQ